MSEPCRPCQEIACTNPDDLTSYGLEGHITTPSAPVVPLEPYGNSAIYYAPCTGDEVLSVSGNLPSWITLDTVNNRLVGAANTFRGTSPAIANARAQASLNSFGASATASGDLECSICPAPAANVVVALGTTQGYTSVYCSSNNRLFVASGNTNKIAIINVAAQTGTTVTIAGASYFNDINYSPVQDRIYALYNPVAAGPMKVAVLDNAGALIATYTTGLAWDNGGLTYDSVHDRIGISGALPGAGSDVEIFNCSGLTQGYIGAMPTGVFYIVHSAVNDTYYVTAIALSGEVYKINGTSFAVTTSTFHTDGLGPAPWYIPDSELLLLPNVAGNLVLMNPNSDTEVWNTGYSGAANGAAFNPCRNEIQFSFSGTGLVCIDGSSYAASRIVTIGANDAFGANYSTLLNQTFCAVIAANNAIGVS